MANRLKTFSFLIFLSAILIAISLALGGSSAFAIGIIFGIPLLFFAYWFSDRIILSMHQCKEVEPLESNGLYEMVERLAQRAGIPSPKVYLIPDHSPNSFSTGRNPDHASIAVTQGLIGILNHHELEAILAHEIGHIRNRDVLLNTVVAAIASAILYFTDIQRWGVLLGTTSPHTLALKRGKASGFRLLITAALTPIAAGLIQFVVSRSREFNADSLGAQLCGNPQSLATALKKIQISTTAVSMASGGPTTAHLYVVNPFSGTAIFNMFSTHPPLEDRIGRLLAMRTE